MTQLTPTPEETRRLAELRELMVLDSAPEPLFDTLAQAASDICGTPIALVSLVDAERQWFKANVGLPGVTETPREAAFCNHAIRQDALLQVDDATADARFADNPLVTGAPHIRFYAGAPLVLASGERVGTLCVIDRRSRRLSAEQERALGQLARTAAQALEMRRNLVHRSLAVRDEHERRVAQSESRLRAILDAQQELVSQATSDGRLVYVNPAYAAHVGLEVEAIVGTSLFDYVDPADRSAVRARVKHVLETGEVLTSENRRMARRPAAPKPEQPPRGAASEASVGVQATSDGEERWVAWTNTRQFTDTGEPLLHSTGRDITERVRAEQALRTSRAFLARTGQLAGVGGWALDIASGEITWADETRLIHEVPADYQPTLENAISFYAPEARPVIERAVQQGLEHGTPWDLELPFVTAKGRHLWVRAVGEVEFEDVDDHEPPRSLRSLPPEGAGLPRERLKRRPVRLIGAFKDITERHGLQARVAANERFLGQLTDNLPVRVAYVDHEGRYRFVNREWCRVTGIDRDRALGRTRAELLPQHDDEPMRRRALAALAGEEQRFEFDEVIDDRARRFEARLIPDRDDSGRVQGYFASGVDITERAAAARELARQALILRSVADAIPSPVAVMDPQGHYRFVNRAFENDVGMASAEILGRSAREILGDAELARRRPWIEQVLAGRRTSFELDHPGREGEGLRYKALDYIPLRSPSGDVDGFVVVTQDITQRRREEARLRRLSQTDSLTGLSNRAGFERGLQELLDRPAAHARRTDPVAAVIYVDLDRFKPVNDTHGHAAGDEVLAQIALRIARQVRPTDTVARLGGDEFALLLPGMKSVEGMTRVCRQIVEAVAAPVELRSGVEVNVSASVGAALGHATGADWAELLARADRMLYRAKHAGRGRFAIDPGTVHQGAAASSTGAPAS